MVNVALGSDHGGYRLKQEIIRYLEERGIPYKDFGCGDTNSCDYPEFGAYHCHSHKVAYYCHSHKMVYYFHIPYCN